jgi:hexosaminidase
LSPLSVFVFLAQIQGLLLDTANHFLSVPTVLDIVGEMAYNRLNVLHWHIEDSYSFPFASESFPRLAQSGAWSETDVYTHADVSSVVEYARLRGVRVVLELDVPGHTYSWGLSYPNATIPCPHAVKADIGSINSVGLDPSNEEAYQIVGGLLQEFMKLAADEYLHLGGDEVKFECWNKSEVSLVSMSSLLFIHCLCLG